METRQVLSIPRAALIGESEPRVLVVDADNRPQERKVRTGIRNDEYVQILDGLLEGERVVVSGKQDWLPE